MHEKEDSRTCTLTLQRTDGPVAGTQELTRDEMRDKLFEVMGCDFAFSSAFTRLAFGDPTPPGVRERLDRTGEQSQKIYYAPPST